MPFYGNIHHCESVIGFESDKISKALKERYNVKEILLPNAVLHHSQTLQTFAIKVDNAHS